jgi:hypothetical protein
MAVEISIRDGHYQALKPRGAGARLRVALYCRRAFKPTLGLARRRATIPADLVAVVALLVGVYVTIPASMGAGAGDPTGVAALGLIGACLRAARSIAIKETVIFSFVAALVLFHYAIAANSLGANGLRRRFGAIGARFNLTSTGTTVTVCGVAVIASLGHRPGCVRSHNAVTADWDTGLAGHSALPARFDGFAVPGTTIATHRVAVIAGFLAHELPITTYGQRSASSNGRTDPLVRVLQLARLRTAVAAYLIAVIALLIRIELPVATRLE